MDVSIFSGGRRKIVKKILFLIGLIVLSYGLVACSGSDPQIEVETAAIDLGEVVNGDVVTRDVAVKNVGSADLTIENVSTSCGCTQASLDKMVIPPGDSATLHIEFDSGAHGEELTGDLVRQVFVVSNDPQQAEATVELTATILLPTVP
jgi:hypothetical protein